MIRSKNSQVVIKCFMDGWSGPLEFLTGYTIFYPKTQFSCSWLVVTKTIYGHVILLYKHRNIKLRWMNDAVQLLNLKMSTLLQVRVIWFVFTSYTLWSFCLMAGAMKVVNHQEVSLVHILGWTKKIWTMHEAKEVLYTGVEVFKILFIVIRKLGIYFFHPPIGNHIFTCCPEKCSRITWNKI